MTTTETPPRVMQSDRYEAAGIQEWNGDDMPLAARMLGGQEDDHPLVQAFARHREAHSGAREREAGRRALIEQEAIDLIVDLCGSGASQSGTNCRVVEDHLKQFARRLAALSARPEAVDVNAGRERLTGETLFRVFMAGDTTRLTTTALPNEWPHLQSSYRQAWDDIASALTARPDGEMEVPANLQGPAIPAGMVRWDGGGEPPRDWDGGPVLYRNGIVAKVAVPYRWLKSFRENEDDIIAYTPSPTTNAGGEREIAEELADLKQTVIAFAAPWAMTYARDSGFPEGHIHPVHYDILAKCGARMDDFTRAALATKDGEGAFNEMGDSLKVEALREALTNMIALYDADEGCRSLPQVVAARAILATLTKDGAL